MMRLVVYSASRLVNFFLGRKTLKVNVIIMCMAFSHPPRLTTPITNRFM